jgi:glyceraldehyde-3-phosphate dehydrogenase (NAD(P))
MWEVAIWEDILTVEGRELFYVYQVDNQAIVVPETVDAIRALSGTERDPAASIRRTDEGVGDPAAIPLNPGAVEGALDHDPTPPPATERVRSRSGARMDRP